MNTVCTYEIKSTSLFVDKLKISVDDLWWADFEIYSPTNSSGFKHEGSISGIYGGSKTVGIGFYESVFVVVKPTGTFSASVTFSAKGYDDSISVGAIIAIILIPLFCCSCIFGGTLVVCVLLRMRRNAKNRGLAEAMRLKAYNNQQLQNVSLPNPPTGQIVDQNPIRVSAPQSNYQIPGGEPIGPANHFDLASSARQPNGMILPPIGVPVPQAEEEPQPTNPKGVDPSAPAPPKGV